MSLRAPIQSDLIDVIEWLEDSADDMVWHFARSGSDIKSGAQLIVRPGQVAIFVGGGTVADVFEPGRYTLATPTLPVLSRLRGRKYGFESLFKADVIFVSTRQFPSHKWGTKAPVMMTDSEFGPVRLCAYGTYIARVSDAETFVSQLNGANATYLMQQVTDQIRALIVTRVADVIGAESVSFLKLTSRYSALGKRSSMQLKPDLARLGLELTELVVESIALSDEVSTTLDQCTRVRLIGDVRAYAARLAADAIRESARDTPASEGSAAVGVGATIAGQLAHSATAVMQPTVAISAAVQTSRPEAHVHPRTSTSRMFYAAVNGQPQGPFDAEALAARVKGGVFARETRVWREGMAEWLPALQVAEVAALIVC